MRLLLLALFLSFTASALTTDQKKQLREDYYQRFNEGSKDDRSTIVEEMSKNFGRAGLLYFRQTLFMKEHRSTVEKVAQAADSLGQIYMSVHSGEVVKKAKEIEEARLAVMDFTKQSAAIDPAKAWPQMEKLLAAYIPTLNDIEDYVQKNGNNKDANKAVKPALERLESLRKEALAKKSDLADFVSHARLEGLDAILDTIIELRIERSYQTFKADRTRLERNEDSLLDGELIETQVLQRLCLMRTLMNRSAFVQDTDLSACARAHSEDMQTANYLGHESKLPGLATIQDRAKAAALKVNAESVHKISGSKAADITKAMFLDPKESTALFDKTHKTAGIAVAGDAWTILLR